MPSGFDLLASESPERLTQPVKEWVQSRYHAFLVVPKGPREIKMEPLPHAPSRLFDELRERAGRLMIRSSPRPRWIGNGSWRPITPRPKLYGADPQWTCQHSDPKAPLAAHGRVQLEVKVFVFRGGLADLPPRLAAERAGQHAYVKAWMVGSRMRAVRLPTRRRLAFHLDFKSSVPQAAVQFWLCGRLRCRGRSLSRYRADGAFALPRKTKNWASPASC